MDETLKKVNQFLALGLHPGPAAIACGMSYKQLRDMVRERGGVIRKSYKIELPPSERLN